MSERVVKITVAAQVNSYLNGMDQVAKKSREGRTEAEQLTRQLEAQAKAFDVVGKSMLVAGGIIAAGLALAVKKAADFDQAMSNVQAATHESTENMHLLREAALEAGASTVFSATESANAIEELAKAGLSTTTIITGGLKGALDLAAAGGLGVADAAGIAATTLKQFNLQGKDSGKVADVLAAGAGKAMGDVTDLSMALSQSGTVAAQFDLTLEETVGSLSAFASAGLLGSDAGTSFRSMLLRLANPTGEAARTMKDLGIEAYDAQGGFVGIEALAGQLQERMSGLTQEQRNAALAIIFGQDAIRAANILYKEGADGIADWTEKVNDAGFAAETAEKRLDNLRGDLERLSGALDSALISVGDAGQGPLRALAQGFTELVDSFNALPEDGKAAVAWIGFATSAVALAGGAFFVAVPKVAAFNAAVGELGPGAQRASRGLGLLAKAGGGAVALIAGAVALNSAVDGMVKALGQSAEETANKVKTATTAVELLSGALDLPVEVAKLRIDGLGESLDKIGRGGRLDPLTELSKSTFTRLGEELGRLAQNDLPAAQAQFARLAESAELTGKQQTALLAVMDPYRKALIDLATAEGVAADDATILEFAVGGGADATEELADAATVAEEQLTAMEQALSDVNATAIGMSSAVDSAKGAINDLAEASKLAEGTINGTDDASIAFRDAMRNVEQSSKDAAQAILDNGGTLDEATAAYERGRDEITKALVAKGLDEDAARAWADEQLGAADIATRAIEEYSGAVSAIPTKHVTSVLVYGTEDAERTLSYLTRRRTAAVDVAIRNASRGVESNGGYAAGGKIPGPPSNVDNIYAPLATGEFVVRASQVAHPENLRVLEYINRGGRMRGFADGGFVQPQYTRTVNRMFHSGFGDSRGAISITNEIHPAPGMSEEQIGRVAGERTAFVLRGA